MSYIVMFSSCTVFKISPFYEIGHSKITQDYRQFLPSLDRTDFLLETGKVSYAYF